MNKRKLYIVVLVVSVVGLFAVQYQYLNIGLNLAKVQFQKKIGNAALEIKEDLSTENQLTFLIGRALTLDEAYFTLSMDSVQDASRHFLNDFITFRLTEQGIDKSFAYRLYAKGADDYLKSPQSFSDSTSLITYPIAIKGYLPELMESDMILELQFDDLNRYFLFQLNGLTIPSLLFMAGILFVIVWVLRSFYWQSRIITTTNDFINNLTHELKTPVFSIALASKILEEKVAKTHKSVVHLIQSETDRLKSHIEKVLALSTLESGKTPFDIKLIDLAPAMKDLNSRYSALAELEGFSYTGSIPEEPIMVKADQDHWIHALNNLWDNAKNYAPEGTITFSVLREGAHWVFAITDDGPGIAKEQQELIFEKYYRGAQDNTHRVKGYGLGLNYVREIVKAHNGGITVDSTLGQGTTISLSLQAHECH